MRVIESPFFWAHPFETKPLHGMRDADDLPRQAWNVGITSVINQPCLGDGEKNGLYIPIIYGDL